MLSRIVRGLFLLILGFVALRLGTPYVENYQFTRLILDEVEAHGSRTHPDVLHDHIVKIGQEMGLNVGPDEVGVEQTPRGLEAHVNYSIPVDLIWYQYRVSFKILVHSKTIGD